MTAIQGARADRLLDTLAEKALQLNDPITGRAARRVVHLLLDRAETGTLSIEEHVNGRPRSFRHFAGSNPGIQASVAVHDARAYTAIVREGSVGLGRGFIEGWWSADDPVAVVRYLIGNLGAIDAGRNRWHRRTHWLTEPVRARRRPAGPKAHRVDHRRRNREEIEAHYDIGNDFFALFLDETMTYSAAVFPTPESSLADASRHKYDRLLGKVGVGAHHRLLEIGTGWGGLAIRAAETIGCSVTSTTISSEQLREARQRVNTAGFSGQVELLDRDWRDLPAFANPRFDRLISIEMIEAVDWRDYDEFFATIERCLTADGVAGMQAICLPDDRWERGKHTKDFISRFVFPNGCLPSVAAIEQSVASATSMYVADVEDLTPHYAETLARWRAAFDSRLEEVSALGLDERFQRLWRFYLAYSEAAFRERHCLVVQLVLKA
ncbi:MAG: cyclopropane-fatty-acyl-phospholipid synthase [Actinomycetota bacterium]|nr:cyclopropane-fatty-acyl-phospholipid synthase [Actinomycetota bacterium]